MASQDLSKFLVRVTLHDINAYKEHPDETGIIRIAENVRTFVKTDLIAPNQARLLFDAMEMEYDVPDPDPEQTDEGLTLQDVSDAVADLSMMVSSIIEPESEV